MTPLPIFLYAFLAPINESAAVQIALVAVGLLVILDLLFGMLGAITQKNFQSSMIRKGLAHKCSEFAFILVADIVDALLYGGITLPFEVPAGGAMLVVCVALIIMEIASIMENATRINPKLSENPLFKILDDANIIHAEHAEA